MKMNKLLLLILIPILYLNIGILSAQTDDELESDGIPSDILEMMKDIPGFNVDRDYYNITYYTGWISDESPAYGLVSAEIVNFEWEDYSGTQTKSLYRDFESETKYTDYIEWIAKVNIVSKLVSVIVNGNSDESRIVLSRFLNFPVRFNYTLELDDEIILTKSNETCGGTEIINSEIFEQAGDYKLHYNLNGYENTVMFSVREK
jgi:hypothetical protein